MALSSARRDQFVLSAAADNERDFIVATLEPVRRAMMGVVGAPVWAILGQNRAQPVPGGA
jgi:hypothetical protein